MVGRAEGTTNGTIREIPLGAGHGVAASEGHHSLVSNVIVTSKYTAWNFLPKNIWEQLHKAANLYFFTISIVMALGNLTPLFHGTINFASTFATLVIMMAFSSLIAGLDDRARHRADAQTNSQPACRISVDASGGAPKVERTEWSDVRVGDFLVVKSEEDFPADLVPLACSGDEGGCYVSTANLDGETNLKIKTAAQLTQHALCGGAKEGAVDALPLLDRAVANLTSVSGVVSAEAPQKSIHNFKGTLCARVREVGGASSNTASEETAVSLGPQQLLLRGTTLRNTAWCLGIVVYTGHETRMAMNSRSAPSKIANIERTINRVMMVVIGAQAAMALVCDIAFNLTLDNFSKLWYLSVGTTLLPNWISSWLTFFVLFSNLMPISLYATMEVCNFAQAYFIQSDLEMYDADEDCPAKARTTNLGHELGQVSYIFSDKTGTLTQNVMELKQVSITGSIFGSVKGPRGFRGGPELAEAVASDPAAAAAIEGFLEVLAVSHTVVATTDQNGRLRYEAESPDEGALVEAAADVEWRFLSRKGQTMTIEVGSGAAKRSETYSILALNAFTSARKRQSVVAQRASGERVLLVKGADNVMIDRAASVHASVNEHLTAFAEQGLRTLVLGRRTLPDAEFARFLEAYTRAQTTLTGREEALAAVAESIEKDLDILGVTAIEDKLQVGVQDTIERLRAAGIKLWVLTGDKLETARNIGFSARVLSSEMEILMLEAEHGEGQAVATRALQMGARLHQAVNEGKTVALMITGQAIEELTNCGAELDFLHLASRCSVVIACRVSPSQKAQMVRLVREGVKPTPVTLAVGDGANDVPMIQEAQVGVGISGREGKQAVNSADFGIGQFRYLQRLLLVHGRWNYRRVAKFTLYSFWKNAVLVLLMFYYVFISGNVGTSLFENWVRASYNVVLAVPIICVGVFDRDVSDKDALEHPELYDTGRRGLDLNAMKLIETLLSAVVHSVVLVIMMGYALPHFVARGAADYYTFSTAVFTWLVITMNYRVAFLTTTWNRLSLVGLAFSFALYILFLGCYCFIQWQVRVFSPWMYWVPVHMLSTPVFWVGCFVAPALATVIDIFKAYLLLEFVPDRRDLILERAGDKSERQLQDDDDSSGGYGGALDEHVPRPTAQAWQTVSDLDDSAQPPCEPASSFVFDHPEGPSRRVGSLQAADPTAGDTSCTDWSQAQMRSLGQDLEGEQPERYPKRPNASAFSQQTLPSWQFVLSWRITFALTAVLGSILLLLAGLFWIVSGGKEIKLQYDGTQFFEPEGLELDQSSAKNCTVTEGGTTNSCTFKARVTQHMKAPIRVDFVVDPFYQNHASFLESFDWQELQGTVAEKSPCKFMNEDSSGARLFPCGLQATSLFNDTFSIVDDFTDEELLLSKQGIAWETDVKRFHNPEGYPGLPGMNWLFQRFPSIIPEELGVQTEAFAAWVRPSFSPIVQKAYAVILDHDLQEGQTIFINVNASFPITNTDARKMLVLATTGPLGGPSDGFERFLLGAGSVCWAAALVVAAIQCSCSRKRGEGRRRRSADDDDDSGGSGSSEIEDTDVEPDSDR